MADDTASVVPPTIALDGTLLLAADSYVRSNSLGRKDPDCESAFEIAATAFCNPVGLWYPTPAQPVEPAFPIFGLWALQGDVQPNLALSSAGLNTVIDQLRPRFRIKLSDDTKQVNDWLAFQFAEEMTGRYLAAGNAAGELDQYCDLVGDVLDDAGIRARLDVGRTWHIPLNLRQSVGSSPSDLRLALAYTFQAYVKAVPYAWGLHDAPSKPIYYPHWLRQSAFDVPGLVAREVRISGRWNGCFPWGIILKRVFNPADPDISDGRLRDVFLALRDHSHDPQNSWVFALPPQTRGASSVRRAVEDYVLAGLQRAGIAPKYRHSLLLSWIEPVVEDFSKGHGILGKIGYQIFHSLLQAEWVRRAEFMGRRTFRIGSIRNAFRSVGVDEAIDRFSETGKPGRGTM